MQAPLSTLDSYNAATSMEQQNYGYIPFLQEQHIIELGEEKTGIDFDMVDIDEGETPLIFAGAGVFTPTPAAVSAMLLGLEDMHGSSHEVTQPEPRENSDVLGADLLEELGDRPVTIFNVQGPLTI